MNCAGGWRIFVLLAVPAVVPGQTIIIDHTSTDLSKIPDYWIERARELTLYYGFTSHGSQIVSGLEALKKQNSRYNYAILRNSNRFVLPTATGALRITGGTPEDYVTPDLFWDSVAGRANTQAAASTGLFTNAAWAWCGQQSSNSVSEVNEYLSVMNGFEQANPSMRFILFTGHTDGGSTTLTRNNNLVRDYARANGKVLFDFADIESWDPAGNNYPKTSDDCAWCTVWCTEHPSDCAVLPSSCAHSHGFNCVLKARAFWWMMARLAGWAGPDAAPSFSVTGVVNAASGSSGAVAAFEVLAVRGTGLGPESGVTMTTSGGKCATTAGGTRVLFDGVAAPVLYASSTQVYAVVPGAVAGRGTTSVQVEYGGVASQSVALNVADYAPAVFTTDVSGQAVALDESFKANGAGNAVARGSTLTVYATAGRKGASLPVDGAISAETTAFSETASAEIGGVVATVESACTPPMVVNGVLQLVIRIPGGAPTGSAVPLYITVGGVRSPAGVTIAVK
jgi:uncharacterized protein (TIGR03437 family)